MLILAVRLAAELPQINAYFQSGGLADAVLNLGLPAPIDVQVAGKDIEETHRIATEIAQQVRGLPGVSDVLVPQDVVIADAFSADAQRASAMMRKATQRTGTRRMKSPRPTRSSPH